MSVKNLTRSMTSFRGHCDKKAKKIDDFLSANPDPNSKDLQDLEELNSDLKDQLRRMEVAWEAMMDETDNDTYDALDKMLNEVSEEVAKTLATSEKTISEKSASTSTGATSSTGNAKIDDTLKPRQELLRSFTLEEANVWFDGFTAYFKHNEKALQKLPASVHRQILNNSIEAALANALQADDEITAATHIIGDNGCLSRLKHIFLEKNPLFLRRHKYQQCRQMQGETVMEWWVRKKTKERECELEQIKLEDIRLLELIRGVQDPRLKEEFLKQKEPTLNQLLEIAERWQTAEHVGKEMDCDSVSAKKTSSYKAEKTNNWAKEVEERGYQTQTKGTEDTCHRCGNTPKHAWQNCPAKKHTCLKCKKRGHFGTVCQSSGSGKPQPRAPEVTTLRTVRASRVEAVSATPQKQWPRGILQKISAYERSEHEAWRGKDKRDADKASRSLEPQTSNASKPTHTPVTVEQVVARLGCL